MPPELLLRHFVSSPVIEGDGDRAGMLLYVEVKNVSAGGSTFLIGRSHDDLERVDGRWKFARRFVDVDHVAR